MARGVRGEYKVDPESRPRKNRDGTLFWMIKGMTVAGDRIRLRFKVYRALEEKLEALKNADRTRRGVVPAVVTTNILTNRTIVTDVETGYSLLRAAGFIDDIKDPVTQAIRYSLKNGFNPRESNKPLSHYSDLYVKHVDALEALPAANRHRISKVCACNYRAHWKYTVSIYGGVSVSRAAQRDFQQKVMGSAKPGAADPVLSTAWHAASTLSPSQQASAQRQLSLFFGMAKAQGWLGNYDPVYRINYDSQTSRLCLTEEQQQRWVDEAWEWGNPAGALILLFTGLRPSEIDHPDSYITADLSTVMVADECKTGYRPVDIPPICRVLLGILKKLERITAVEGKVGFTGPRSEPSWKVFRARVGFPLQRGIMRTMVRNALPSGSRTMSISKIPDDVVDTKFQEIFRSKWPLRWEKYIPDSPRHTAGTAHCRASGSPALAASYLGDTVKTALRHYLGKMTWQEAIAFYRRIPSSLSEVIDLSIPKPTPENPNPHDPLMPHWFSWNLWHSGHEVSDQITNQVDHVHQQIVNSISMDKLKEQQTQVHRHNRGEWSRDMQRKIAAASSPEEEANLRTQFEEGHCANRTAVEVARRRALRAQGNCLAYTLHRTSRLWMTPEQAEPIKEATKRRRALLVGAQAIQRWNLRWAKEGKPLKPVPIVPSIDEVYVALMNERGLPPDPEVLADRRSLASPSPVKVVHAGSGLGEVHPEPPVV